MRIIVCGDRGWTDSNMITQVLDGIYQFETLGFLTVDMWGFTLIEGGARGADAVASWWAENSPMHSHNERPDDPPFEHIKMEADWETHGKAAGPMRNQMMLEKLIEGNPLEPRLVVGFHDDIERPKCGTRNMLSIAKKAGIRTWLMQHWDA